MFRAHTPYPPASVPVERLTLPSITPAFMEPGIWSEASTLPTVWVAMTTPEQLRPRLWKPGGSGDGNPVSEVQDVLSQLADCLYTRPQNRWRDTNRGGEPPEPQPITPSWTTFCYPLADVRHLAPTPTDTPGAGGVTTPPPWRAMEPACMLPDPALVEKMASLWRHKKPSGKGWTGYVQMDLCHFGRRRRITEYAHRFLYWAICGAPQLPMTWETAVLLHNCHEESCLNPLHMRWGTQAENIQHSRGRERAKRGRPPID